MLKLNKVSRNKIKRQVSSALRSALHSRGVSWDGKSLADGQQLLKGHVQISAKQELSDASLTAIKQEMDILVDQVARSSGAALQTMSSAKPA